MKTLMLVLVLTTLTAGQDQRSLLEPPEPDPAQELVERIRENLRRLDELILDTALDDDVAGGLSDVRQGHLDVIRDLDELIKQVKYSQSNQGGGGGGQSSPPPPQGGNQQQPRDSDGSSAPDPSSQDGQQQQGGEPEQADSQGQESRSERGGEEDRSAGEQRDAEGPPPPDPLGDYTRDDTDGRWGLLPPKVQERLMNLHVDDVPERYRAWLEAYIRAMHAAEGDGR